jgi:ribose/xylose/arabinose/galactoside ABC-type transport system permease subunit
MNLNRYIPKILDNLIWILLIGVWIFFSLTTDSFVTIGNLRNIMITTSVLGLLVIGEAFTLITGNFDLSVESTLGMAGVMGIWLVVPKAVPTYGSGLELHPFVSVAIILVVGLIIGWFIGNLITRFKMNNFIVTLAMLISLRGLTLVINEGQTVYGSPDLYNILGGGSIGPLPVAIPFVLIAFIIAHIVLSRTQFGRELYAVGANREAARASGVNPERRIRQVYIISAFMAALAGWLLSGRLTNTPWNIGQNMIFDVMAASVIGGISLQGGRGTMLGALGGVILLASITSGLNLMDVDPFWVETIRGAIILVAMLIDAQKVRYSAKVAKEIVAAEIPKGAAMAGS